MGEEWYGESRYGAVEFKSLKARFDFKRCVRGFGVRLCVSGVMLLCGGDVSRKRIWRVRSACEVFGHAGVGFVDVGRSVWR